MSDPHVAAYQSMLDAGIVALRAGQTDQARNLLRQVVRNDPGNERAWLFLAGALADNTQRRYCLEQVLSINPQSVPARRGLSALAVAAPPAPPPQVAAVSEPHISSPASLKAEERTPQQLAIPPAPVPAALLQAAPVERPTSVASLPSLAASAPPAAASPAPAAFALPMLSARFEPTVSVEPSIVAPPSVAAVAPPTAQLILPISAARPANQLVWGMLLALGLLLMLSSTIYTILLLRG